jgi:hypothetical protein
LNAYDNGVALVPSDRTGVLSFGTFDLAPGEWVSFTFAYLWARGNDHIDSIRELRNAAGLVHANRAAILTPQSAGNNFEDGNPPATPQFPFWVDNPYPNPADDRITLNMSLKWDAPVTITVTDVLGRTRIQETFQGTKGATTRTLNATLLTSGTYLIRVSQRGEHVDQTLIVF